MVPRRYEILKFKKFTWIKLSEKIREILRCNTSRVFVYALFKKIFKHIFSSDVVHKYEREGDIMAFADITTLQTIRNISAIFVRWREFIVIIYGIICLVITVIQWR